MIAIIDYSMGNVRSMENALKRLGADYVLTSDPLEICSADKVILPGVGHCGEAMHNLMERGLTDIIRGIRHPVLGICVGMQAMCRHSEEGDIDGLNIFDAKVQRICEDGSVKIPHMGWNTISNLDSNLFRGINGGEYVYFVHSYCASTCPDTIATASYGTMFSAALKYENFYGTQFHPEKSGATGELILKNFLSL